MKTRTKVAKTKPTVPQSLDVLMAQIHEADPVLCREIAELRAELEPLVDKVVPLLGRIMPLLNRTVDVAGVIDNAPYDASNETWCRVMDASGGEELDRMLGRIAAAGFPDENFR
jgi:hypothetical protein